MEEFISVQQWSERTLILSYLANKRSPEVQRRRKGIFIKSFKGGKKQERELSHWESEFLPPPAPTHFNTRIRRVTTFPHEEPLNRRFCDIYTVRREKNHVKKKPESQNLRSWRLTQSEYRLEVIHPQFTSKSAAEPLFALSINQASFIHRARKNPLELASSVFHKWYFSNGSLSDLFFSSLPICHGLFLHPSYELNPGPAVPACLMVWVSGSDTVEF